MPATRGFLGDLYQDLSEDVRKKYALLQTPAFVEQFILDRTLSPALDEFGLEAVRLIDPTCGSGHFLLGAFERLFQEVAEAAWQQTGDRARHQPHRPGPEMLLEARICRHVDINPYAVAIARFQADRGRPHRLRPGKVEATPRHWTLHVSILGTASTMASGGLRRPNQVNDGKPPSPEHGGLR